MCEDELMDNEAVVEENLSPEAVLRAQIEELEDKYKRALADLDNQRKRNERQIEILQKYGTEFLILDMLRPMEDMERALQSGEMTKEELLDGLKMILADMKTTLARYGVCEISGIGEEFDPCQHEAVLQEETSSRKKDGKVAEELQRGYKLHDKVIRHSKVKVTKYKEET